MDVTDRRSEMAELRDAIREIAASSPFLFEVLLRFVELLQCEQARADGSFLRKRKEAS